MKKKNILLYFTDQQRADTCGCYGQDYACSGSAGCGRHPV